MKRIALILPLLSVFLLSACDRKNDPIRATPDIGTNNVSMQCFAVDTFEYPECKAFVRISNQAGTPLTGFELGNFTVMEGSNPVPLLSVQEERPNTPVYVSLCLDMGFEMLNPETTAKAKDAAKQFVNEMPANCFVEVFSFGSANDISRAIGFTDNKLQLLSAIDTIRGDLPSYQVSFYDAVAMSIASLRQQRGKRILMVYSAFRDSASTGIQTIDDLVKTISMGQVYEAYAFGYGRINTGVGEDIANSARGLTVTSPSAGQLSVIYADALEHIANLQVLTYSSRHEYETKCNVYLNYGHLVGQATREFTH